VCSFLALINRISALTKSFSAKNRQIMISNLLNEKARRKNPAGAVAFGWFTGIMCASLDVIKHGCAETVINRGVTDGASR
jgi:hypothetical protein